jgi:hypothetical protein
MERDPRPMEETKMKIMKALTIPLFALAFGLSGGLATPAHAATATTAASEDLWIHIRVHDDKDAKISVNLPVSIIESMAGALPAVSEGSGGGRLRFDDAEVSVADLRRIWRELRRHPEATFLTIDEADSKVRVGRQGAYLVVQAEERRGRSEDMRVRIPVTVVEALLSAPGEQLDLNAALRALARHGEGELVTVTGDDETVRIWVDRSSVGAAR